MTEPEKRWGGYGRYVTRLTDHRRRETIVCFACRGPVYSVQGFGTKINCAGCGREDIRAIEIVRSPRHDQ